jgi:hypothetical protein
MGSRDDWQHLVDGWKYEVDDYDDTLLPNWGFSRVVEWRLSSQTKQRWTELMDELEMYEEGTDGYEAIQDQIRSLPGHPLNTSKDVLILQVVTDIQH